MNKWSATFIKVPIRFYRYFISPLTGQNCRFQPTCSSYAEEAIDKHGALKGLALTGRRLLRCNSWHKGPFEDPVP